MSEQNGNVLNRYAVVVEDTRHGMAKTVNRAMRQAGILGQTVYHSIDCAEIDIRLSENGSYNEVVAFVVAVAKQLGIILLTLLLGFQLSDNKIVYRDFAVTALCHSQMMTVCANVVFSVAKDCRTLDTKMSKLGCSFKPVIDNI